MTSVKVVTETATPEEIVMMITKNTHVGGAKKLQKCFANQTQTLQVNNKHLRRNLYMQGMLQISNYIQ